MPQRSRLGVRYVVEDSAGGSYFHLSESGYQFAGLLDGRRTVAEAWDACNAQLGDDAPTQQEVEELLGQLQLQGFLLGDQPVAADLLAERRANFRETKIKKRTGNYLFFHVPVINPEPILERTKALYMPFFTWWGLVGWGLLVLAAAVVVFSNTDRLGSSFNGALSPANLGWLAVTLVVVRAVHEAGHAVACKAVGARCVEIGIMLVGVVLPLPYCDASSAWKRPRTRDRVLVSLGGIMFEAVLASFATFYWAFAEPGLGRTLAFNIMVISGVSSVIFNLNPLLRYDGYYLLTDLARSPNLAQRSRAAWVFLIERFGFGMRSTRAPHVRDTEELWLLIVYNALAVPYRLMVLVAILLLISEQFLTIGLVLGAVFFVMWGIAPAVKFVWYLLTSPRVGINRMRAIGATLAVAVPAALLLGVVPMPNASYAEGTVQPADRTALRVASEGFIESVSVRAGDRVERGDVLFEMKNPNLELDLEAARAKLDYERALLDDALLRDPVALESQRLAVELAEDAVARFEKSRRDLTVFAPAGGVIVADAKIDLGFEGLVGRFAQKGDRFGWIVSDDRVVRVRMSDQEHGRVFAERGSPEAASVRLHGEAGRVIEARVERTLPAGTRRVEDAALTSAGGGDQLVDPNDSGTLLTPYFRIDLGASQEGGLGDSAFVGRRAKVRFDMPAEAFLPRVARSLKRYFDGRVSG